MDKIEQLRMFVERSDHLKYTKLLKDNIPSRMTFKWDQVKGMQIEFVHPNEEILRSYLVLFRPFMLKREPIYLNRIYNICHKVILSEKLRGYLVESRKYWKESQQSTGIKIIFNERDLTPEYVMDLWINGYYFHADETKYRELKKYTPHEQMIAKNQFLMFLTDATKQILYVNQILKYCFKEGFIVN